MTQYLSEKLKILSAVAIILVLYIHSGFHDNEIQGMALNHYTQELISTFIGRCAVPLFYTISGYLFFLKVPDGLKSIGEKMHKRVHTLLIPYIITALFYVAFQFFINSIPATSKFVNSSILPVLQQSWPRVLVAIFYDCGTGVPLAFHLWFVRDLLILVLLSPLLYLLLRYLGWWWVLLTFLLTYTGISSFPFFAMFWFSLGGALTKNDITVKYPKLGLSLLALFLVICFLQLFSPELTPWKYAKVPFIILGIAAIWLAYDALVPASFSLLRHPWLNAVSNFTFFVYLFHEPTLNVVRKLLVLVIGKNSLGYLFSYLASPWLFIAGATVAGAVFKKLAPRVYSIAVGGR
jgi:surface polysaccharide O-acyltransferase-like enzyme